MFVAHQATECFESLTQRFSLGGEAGMLGGRFGDKNQNRLGE